MSLFLLASPSRLILLLWGYIGVDKHVAEAVW